jgi:hypothetical protein
MKSIRALVSALAGYSSLAAAQGHEQVVLTAGGREETVSPFNVAVIGNPSP